MNLLFYVLFGIVIYCCVLIGGKRFRSTCLYALAIGGAVNANYFTARNYPIDIFGLNFGIDSIIYNLFIFCVIIMLFWKGRGQAYLLSASSIIAIIFAAVIQLISDMLSFGYSNEHWVSFFYFLTSSFSSILAVVAVIELLTYLKNKAKLNNEYLLMIIGLLLATVINTPMYYLCESLIHQNVENAAGLINTSLVGKLITILFSLLGLFLLKLYDKKTNKKAEN